MDTNVLTLSLKHPVDVMTIVKTKKHNVIKSDFNKLLSTSITHLSAMYVAKVAIYVNIMVPVMGPGFGSWRSRHTWPPTAIEDTQSNKL